LKEAEAIHSTFPSVHISEIIPDSRKLSYVALVSVIFFTVCGGAFGIEPLFGKVGAGWAILLILLTPLFWSLPISLMVSELAAAIPVQGGYYVWVKRALGNFWGFQEGWWTICYTAVDMAIYPVLFVNYLAFFVPYLQPDADGNLTWEQFFIRWAGAVAVILCGLILNWNGAKAVGYNSTLFIFVIFLPFILLTYFGLSHQDGGLTKSFAAVRAGFSNEMNAGLFAVGLATVMWNYSGWDNVSTFAEEVHNAPKNYPRALFTALGLAVLMYFLPTFALIGHTTSAEVWNETAGFPVLAEQLGGQYLGILLALAALVFAWGLFNSQILYASRLPFAMANDGWLPKVLAKTNAKGVPINALIVCCGVSALFAALPFGKLVVIDILLYSAELFLEFIALMFLRVYEPDLPRPFKIRGGWFVLILITILPMTFAGTVIYATLTDQATDLRHLGIVVLALISGVILYFLRRNKIENQTDLT
jgi:amino acid transporter